MPKEFPCYLANRAHVPNHDLEVRDKFTHEVAAEVPLCDSATIDRAIAAAVSAAQPMRELAAFERQAALRHCARRFEERSAELADWLCVEAGKPIKDSRGEVGRLVDTFRIAAEESTRMVGEVLPMDVTPRARATPAPGSASRSARARSSRRSTSR